MKKLLLPFVTLCIALNFCTAQTPYESLLLKSPGDFVGANDKAIVRMCNDRYAVAYRTKYDTSGLHSYFCIIDYHDFDVSGTLFPQKYVDYEQNPAMQDIEVKDIRVLDDMVAFCGRRYTSTGSHGVIGFFKWTNLLDDQTVIIVYDTIQSLRSVNKMVFYMDNIGHHKIVAIGSSDNGYTSNRIIEKMDLFNPVYLIASTQYRMSDIVETRNYVAFFIPQDPIDGKISIRRTDKYNIFSSGLNYVYKYNSIGEANGLLNATTLDGDSVAVAYVHPSGNYYRTRLRIVDLVNMINFNSQDYVCDEKYEPYEMVYYPDNRDLVLLHDEKVSNSNVNYFVYFKPYSTISYVTNKLTYPNEYFQTISLYDRKFISATGKKWYIQNILAYFQNTQTCPYIDNDKVFMVESIQPSETEDALIPTPEDLNDLQPSLESGNEWQDISCSIGGSPNLIPSGNNEEDGR